MNTRWLVVLALLSLACCAFAADAATPTVQSQVWDEIIKALTAAVLAALASAGTAVTGAVGSLAYKGWEMVKKWLATTRQGQLFGILTTALEIAVAKQAKAKGVHYREILFDLASIFKDGKVSDQERLRLIEMRKDILSDAAQVAGEMIAECRGLAADQGVKYVAERLDALLGELEYRLTGSPAALIPSGLADSPAAGS